MPKGMHRHIETVEADFRQQEQYQLTAQTSQIVPKPVGFIRLF